MKVLLAHPGTQHSFRLARQLHRLRMLHRFWTGLAYVPESFTGRVVNNLPPAFERRLANRRLDGVDAGRLRTQPLGECSALLRMRQGGDDQRVILERNMAFQRRIPQRELADSDAVIGFDTSSWLLAGRAAGAGRPFLLDQSIGGPERFQSMLPALRLRFPEWAEDVPTRLPEMLDGQKREHEQAHRIVVASSFTRATLMASGVPGEKIVVNPYGVDADLFSPSPRPDRSRKLRFLFLGTVGVRKGVPLLLEVWRSLPRNAAELWLAGPVSERHRKLIPLENGQRLIAKMPHRELPAMLRQCDVLVFPSYFEGFGLVLLEAMAAGMPVIASDATAAPDLITQGEEGYIVPAGDGEALREAMLRFIDSPQELARMSAAARRCAEKYSWEAYGDRWSELLRQAV